MVEHYPRCYTTYWQDGWAGLLAAAMLAINNRNATSIGISPFFLPHGYDLDLLDLAKGQEELRTTVNSPVARGEEFVAKLKEAVEVAQAAMATAQELQEECANRARQVAEQFRVEIRYDCDSTTSKPTDPRRSSTGGTPNTLLRN